MKIKEIIEILKEADLVKRLEENIDFEKEILDITYDSRACKDGTCFFVKGATFKEEYLKYAIELGTSLVITEIEYGKQDVGMVIVNNVRHAMVVVAEKFFDEAYKDLTLIGLTGTKGKTTTTYYLKNMLEEYLGQRVGIISTIEVYTGKREEESHLTTPEAIELQRYFKEMKDSGLKYAVMEVSSQAYKKDRIFGMQFDLGLFLNISEDHISPDEHPDFRDYFDCKLQFISNCKKVIINREMDYYEEVEQASKNAKKIMTYGTKATESITDYHIENIETVDGCYIAEIVSKEYNQKIKIKMPGRFNVENAMAAISIAREYGVDNDSIQKGLTETDVKGRMNVYEKDGVMVIVDYAHNKLAFTRFFETLKTDYPGRNIITVAGGPGGKSFARRKDLGEIAGENSSYMYLTAEDPQYEKTIDICKDIAGYVKCPYEIIEDRTEAVEKAIKNAKPGDIVALLAKGEEPYQKVEGKFIPYESDLKIAERLMK